MTRKRLYIGRAKVGRSNACIDNLKIALSVASNILLLWGIMAMTIFSWAFID